MDRKEKYLDKALCEARQHLLLPSEVESHVAIVVVPLVVDSGVKKIYKIKYKKDFVEDICIGWEFCSYDEL
jgi:hypothetical protein